MGHISDGGYPQNSTDYQSKLYNCWLLTALFQKSATQTRLAISEHEHCPIVEAFMLHFIWSPLFGCSGCFYMKKANPTCKHQVNSCYVIVTWGVGVLICQRQMPTLKNSTTVSGCGSSKANFLVPLFGK